MTFYPDIYTVQNEILGAVAVFTQKEKECQDA